MAMVHFQKGLLANLPAAFSEGTFYVTTDEHALYLDVDGSTRIRIGDFQEFATLETLQANTNPSTTALYYITSLNVLAKWNGTSYVQINLDTGATSVEVVDSGNAVTSAAYDAVSRKLTLTMGETFATAAQIGDIDGTVKDYVDEKTAGIASDEALQELQGRMDDLETQVGDTPVADQISGALEPVNSDMLDIKDRVDGLETSYAEIATDIDKIWGIDAGTDKSIRDIANEELVAQLVPESAKESLDTLAEIAAWIQAHPDDASAMNAAITALQEKLDTGDQKVSEYVTAAISALNIGDYAKAADLTALAGRVDTLEGASHEHANKALLDTYTQAEEDLADAVAKKHAHANAAELDKIAEGDKAKWDVAEQNAKSYADSLAVNYDVSGAADAALEDAKDYTDAQVAAAVMTWGSF